MIFVKFAGLDMFKIEKINGIIYHLVRTDIPLIISLDRNCFTPACMVLILTDGCVVSPNGGNLSRISWAQKYDSYPILEALRSCAGSTHPISFGVCKKQRSFAALNLCSTALSTTAQTLSN